MVALLQMLCSYSHATEAFDWSQYNDSILIKIERAKGNKLGNTICSGVIMHPHVVITTGHCAHEALSMTVVFDVENGTAAKKMERVLTKSIVTHPEYHSKKSLYQNDLVMIFLKDPAPIASEMIRKIPKANPLKAGDRLIRLGVGLRDGKNLRNTTNPIFVGIPSKGVMETSDIYSYFGDSGGPLYGPNHELLAVHSTLDDYDGKKTSHAYSVYLADYLPWIEKTMAKYFKK